MWTRFGLKDISASNSQEAVEKYTATLREEITIDPPFWIPT
jgi:hypothetical protein